MSAANDGPRPHWFLVGFSIISLNYHIRLAVKHRMVIRSHWGAEKREARHNSATAMVLVSSNTNK